MTTRRTRIAAVATLGGFVFVALVVGVIQATDTIPPQSPVVTQVQQRLSRGMRQGRLRVLLSNGILEVRLNGEALLGYTGRSPRLEDVDTSVVRDIAKWAIDLYAPPRFGPPPGVDSVRVQVRHSYMLGPIPYRVARRNYDFATSQLGR